MNDQTKVEAVLDYPVVEIPNVEPIFVRSMLIGAMAARFMGQVPDLSQDEAFDAAMATWETDWPDDPDPRTFQAAKDAVDDELQHWTD